MELKSCYGQIFVSLSISGMYISFFFFFMSRGRNAKDELLANDYFAAVDWVLIFSPLPNFFFFSSRDNRMTSSKSRLRPQHCSGPVFGLQTWLGLVCAVVAPLFVARNVCWMVGYLVHTGLFASNLVI